jgi:pyruvate,orthophosphate dikinase
MFLEQDRLDKIREMIIADTLEKREEALAKIGLLQQTDFEGIFKVMEGLPVAIRTLDLPLHEFLPRREEAIQSLADRLGVSFEKVKARLKDLLEVNPMLGFRGCRLGIIYPEITEMQVRAIFMAAAAVKKGGIKVHPEIMIPFVSSVAELELQELIVRRVATEVQEETSTKIQYLLGTMIELPRAAIVADEIARVTDFFSFGTNDLTQTTLGLSRDDANHFLPQYIDRKVFSNDPFQTIDRQGVGFLVQMATERGRRIRPMLEVGVCGEHGGDPTSVRFFHEVGLSYVSCSPYRLLIARLAAAQAAIA